MDAPLTRFVLPALLTIALHLSVIVIAMMATVKCAQAEGFVPPSLDSQVRISLYNYGGIDVTEIWTIGYLALSAARTAAETRANQLQTAIPYGLHVSDVNPRYTWFITLVKPVYLGSAYFYYGLGSKSYSEPPASGIPYSFSLIYLFSVKTEYFSNGVFQRETTLNNGAVAQGYTGKPTCPANSTGTPTASNPTSCTCSVGYVPDPTVTSCVIKVQNSITFQKPLADIEPSGTAGGGSTSRTAYAQVVNTQTNLPQAGVQVKFSVDVKARTGGHNHDDASRPKGKLLDCRYPYSEVDSTICITQLDGKATATFSAPIVSGTHTITATCVSPACTGPASGDINVKVDGLETIPASQFYTFIGTADKHSDNHYLTPDAASQLWRLAATYYFMNRQDTSVPLLHLNDASLVWGGKFDVAGHWTSGAHAGHRRGAVIDIRANALPTAIPESLFADFEKLAAKTGLADGVTSAIAQLHCSDGFDHANNCAGDTNRHYHVILLGVDQ